MGLFARRLLAVTGIVASAYGVSLAEGCSPTAAQTFAPDTGLPTFDGAFPSIVFDGGPEPVRVVAASIAGPTSGITIVFDDANGNVVAVETTDSGGRAEHLLAAGGSVTALVGSVGAPSAITYLAVEPGDLLVAYDTSVLPNDNFVNIVDVPGGPPKQTSGYNARSGNCETGYFTGPSGSYSIDPPGCLNPAARFPVLLEALDTSEAPVAFTFLKEQTLDVDAGANVHLDGATWSTAQGTWTVDITNATTSSPLVVFSEAASFVPLSTSIFAQSDGKGGFVPPTFGTHPGYADFFQTELQVSSSNKIGTTFTVLATRTPAPAQDGNVSFDMSVIPPAIDTLTWDFKTDASRPSITFQPNAPITSAAGTYVVLNWTNQGDGGTQTLTSNTWTIIAPPTLTTIIAPALPATAAAWTPAGLEFGPQTPTVAIFSGDGIASYTDFRRLAAAIPPPSYGNMSFNSNVAPLLPFDGTLALTTVGPFLE